MSRNYRLLNDIWKSYNEQINSQKKLIVSLSKIVGELKGRLAPMVILSKKPLSERPFEFLKPCFFFKPHIELNPLPLSIIQLILPKVEENFYKIFEAIQTYFCHPAYTQPNHISE